MSAKEKGFKTGYCRIRQNPFPGCGAKSPRKLCRVAIGPAVLWLCKSCFKRYRLEWPGGEK